jgi:hypothetical protein
MRRAFIFLLCAVLSGLALTACGGSSNKRLSKPDFVAKADGICAKANKDAPKPPSDLANVDPTAAGTTKEQLDEFGTFFDKLVKHFRGELDDLRGVKPPADLQDTWDRALASLEETLNEADDAAQAAHDGDRATMKAKLDESDKHSKESDVLAKQLGLKVCGNSSA